MKLLMSLREAQRRLNLVEPSFAQFARDCFVAQPPRAMTVKP